MHDILVSGVAAFLGSAVESVEALTIVLAVGLTRGWRAPLYGTAAALGVLAVLVVTLGSVLTRVVPESTLKLVIGSLILLFGWRWLHKATLRSAGVIAMHDEAEEFRETVGALGGSARTGRFDAVGFAVAFKGVFLEGVEVAFIVVAVGSNSGSTSAAVIGGVLAMVVVAIVGVLVRRPLARVPENALKHSVGIMLCSLGTFWAAEGMGVSWPYDVGSIPVLVAIFGGTTWLAVQLARRSARPSTPRATAAA